MRRSASRPINEADAIPLSLAWFREAVEDWAPQPRNEAEVEEAAELESEMEATAR